ncbi:MAG TPA: shikimate dehydrogenase [Thermoleophilaceae bacterium]|nr:shikimate dehydrogenase [Thermoleophilaceae bacterium]
MTPLAGVIGFPVGHSRSPAMMNAAFAALGLDWHYVKLPLPPERFDAGVRALPGSGYRGANVTLPHKLAAHELADELSDAARAIGAVNTLTLAEGGGIAGHNTDAGGLLDALGDELPPTALVLGAGGAARAAAWALASAGARVTVWNRTGDRAQALASDLGVEFGERPAEAELLVNATSVGLRADDSLAGLPLVDAHVVVDLVYGDAPTPILRWGEERGARVVGGLEVLVRQGARSLALWTGMDPPLDAMRRAVVQPTSSTSAQV